MFHHLRQLTVVFFILLTGYAQLPSFAIPPFTSNAEAFQPVFRTGRGLPQHIEWHPTQNVILMDTTIGAWLYSDQLEDITFLPDARLAHFSPNGLWLAGVDDNQNITIWDGLSYEHVATLHDQPSFVTQIAWNPDNVQVAIARDDGVISVWNVDTQEQVLFTHTNPIIFLKWNPSGTILAANTPQNAIYLWDFSETNPSQRAGIAQYDPYIVSYDYSSIARLFDWVSDTYILRSSYTEFGYITYVELRDINEYEPLLELDSTASYTWEISPNRNFVAFGDRVYDPYTLTQISNTNLLDVISVEWSPDSRRLAATVWHIGNTAKRAKRLFVINPQNGEVRLELAGHTTNIDNMVWSHDSRHLLTADDSGRIRIWDTTNGQPLFLSEKHAQVSSVVAWSPDSTSIAVADQLRAVNIWNVSSNEMTASLRPHPQPASKIVWRPSSDYRPDTDLIATHTGTMDDWSIDNTVRIWDADTGNLFDTIIHPDPLKYTDSIAWQPGGLILAISGGHSIDFWNMATRHAWTIDSCNLGFNTGFCPEIGEIGWNPDGSIYTFGWHDVGYAITARQFPNTTEWLGGYGVSHGHSVYYGTAQWTADSTQWLTVNWQFRTRLPYPPIYSLFVGTSYAVDDEDRLSIQLSGHNGFTQAVYWSPDASLLATIGEDDTTRMWDVATGEELFMTERLAIIAWSPDSHYIAGITAHHTIAVFDAESGEIADEWSIYETSADDLTLAWSPDGNSVALSANGVLTVWSRE